MSTPIDTSKLTKAGQRAVALLELGPLHRSRDGWVNDDGDFVALIVVAKLRQARLVKISDDKRSARLAK